MVWHYSAFVDDLQTAMKEAKAEINQQKSDDSKDDSHETDPTDAEKIQRFVKELVESGIDETLAIKAVHNVDKDDIDKCDVSQGKAFSLVHLASNSYAFKKYLMRT